MPARDWPKGSKRPVFAERTQYPRFLQSEQYNIHGEDYLVENVDSSIYPWKEQEPIFFIDQVRSHTHEMPEEPPLLTQYARWLTGGAHLRVHHGFVPPAE